MGKRLDVCFQRFLPSDVASRGEDWLLRAKLWMMIAALTTVIGFVMGIDHLIRGPHLWGGVLLIGTCVVLALFSILRRTGQLEIVGNILSTLWLVALTGAIFVRGGAGAPGMLMAGIIPMITILYTGWRSGLAWAGVVLLVQASFTLAYLMGYSIPAQVSEESQRSTDTALSFVLTFVLAGVALGYEWFRIANARSRTETDRTRHDAEHRIELSRADRLSSIGLISAGVAHEINNPLSYILGNLDFILEGLKTPEHDDEQWCEDMGMSIVDAIEGAKRIQQIVRDLSTYSRREEEEIECFELQSSINTALKMVDNQLRHSATLELDLGTPAWVRGDASRFTQVFLNILINATQAIRPRDGEENRISISITRADDLVTVRIRDTGVGIPEEILHRTTDPFFTTKTVGEGTGLGLSVSRNLVEHYGGELRLESEVGIGTCVVLSWPEVVPAPHAAIAESSSAAESSALRILIIDDDDLIVRTLRRLLSRHSISHALSGADALAILESDSDFDAILCDLMMPGITGVDVYEQILARRPDIASRFLFMSGGVFGENMEERLEKIDRTVLSKPIDREKLETSLFSIAS